MTVSSTQNYIEYNGDGVTTSFHIPFYFLLNSDICVMVQDAYGNVTEPVNGIDFSVTGSGGSGGGTLTANVAYRSGTTILIYRNPPVTQETKYYENGKFPAASHEAALDKLTMLAQELGWKTDALSLHKPGFFSKYFDALNNRIINLGSPTDENDAANKYYVDSAVKTAVSSEAAERISADNKLQENINAEVSDRQSADANIQEQLTGNTPLNASAFSEISWHNPQIKNSITIPPLKNAWSFGPQMEISPGQAVTISNDSSWTIADGRVVEDESLHNLIADTIKSTDGNYVVNINDVPSKTAIDNSLSQKASLGANSDITSISGLTTPLSVIQGGLGNKSGRAATATKLDVPRGVRVNLASTSAVNFDGSTDINPGVNGILSIINGGTGQATVAGVKTAFDIYSATGVTDGSSVSAGKIGEVLTATSSSISSPSGTGFNIVSLLLTAGDWEIKSMIQYTSSAGLTYATSGVSLTSGTPASFPNLTEYRSTFSSGSVSFPSPTRRVNVASATTIYLVGYCTFSSGSATSGGYIEARRIK